ncbi:GNAT family N-acetyltransferase [Fulvimonas soli]|uniref:N-acetylglutamate synthase-like GNAT family acetyltransferase n=1 Tax=Fulvimonas soli TaxID=155197 RepID=A0A316I9B5_9GAMM|nr:GNAT family N-acetyltransferase [Fulvimonas soli]PWK89827.1 N-acetylglutamate synthase-like GNAT family acetyltransferase [Fulvimonas soli]
MILREATMDDAGGLARLAGELGYPTPAGEMAARLQVLLRDPAHRIRVAADDGRLAGWIDVERRCTLESGERFEIAGLVVDAAARGRGVGRRLVEDAEAWARGQGAATITVRSSVARELSHPFYLRLGYERRKTQHVYAKALAPPASIAP